MVKCGELRELVWTATVQLLELVMFKAAARENAVDASFLNWLLGASLLSSLGGVWLNKPHSSSYPTKCPHLPEA